MGKPHKKGSHVPLSVSVETSSHVRPWTPHSPGIDTDGQFDKMPSYPNRENSLTAFVNVISEHSNSMTSFAPLNMENPVATRPPSRGGRSPIPIKPRPLRRSPSPQVLPNVGVVNVGMHLKDDSPHSAGYLNSATNSMGMASDRPFPAIDKGTPDNADVSKSSIIKPRMIPFESPSSNVSSLPKKVFTVSGTSDAITGTSPSPGRDESEQEKPVPLSPRRMPEQILTIQLQDKPTKLISPNELTYVFGRFRLPVVADFSIIVDTGTGPDVNMYCSAMCTHPTRSTCEWTTRNSSSVVIIDSASYQAASMTKPGTGKVSDSGESGGEDSPVRYAKRMTVLQCSQNLKAGWIYFSIEGPATLSSCFVSARISGKQNIIQAKHNYHYTHLARSKHPNVYRIPVRKHDQPICIHVSNLMPFKSTVRLLLTNYGVPTAKKHDLSFDLSKDQPWRRVVVWPKNIIIGIGGEIHATIISSDKDCPYMMYVTEGEDRVIEIDADQRCPITVRAGSVQYFSFEYKHSLSKTFELSIQAEGFLANPRIVTYISSELYPCAENAIYTLNGTGKPLLQFNPESVGLDDGIYYIGLHSMCNTELSLVYHYLGDYTVAPKGAPGLQWGGCPQETKKTVAEEASMSGWKDKEQPQEVTKDDELSKQPLEYPWLEAPNTYAIPPEPRKVLPWSQRPWTAGGESPTPRPGSLRVPHSTTRIITGYKKIALTRRKKAIYHHDDIEKVVKDRANNPALATEAIPRVHERHIDRPISLYNIAKPLSPAKPKKMLHTSRQVHSSEPPDLDKTPIEHHRLEVDGVEYIITETVQ